MKLVTNCINDYEYLTQNKDEDGNEVIDIVMILV